MTKLRYPFGGAAVKQPCAICAGAAHECCTEPAKQLPVLGGRCACNYEQDTPAAALAGDKLGADYRLYDKSSGRIAPGGQYRRRVGSETDGGAGAKSSSFRILCRHQIRIGRQFGFWHLCTALGRESRCSWWRSNGTSSRHRRQPAHAHREQVHGLLYMAAYRLMLSKGVAA